MYGADLERALVVASGSSRGQRFLAILFFFSVSASSLVRFCPSFYLPVYFWLFDRPKTAF